MTSPVDLRPVKHLNWGRGVHPEHKGGGSRKHREPEHEKKKKDHAKMEPKGLKKFAKLLTGMFRRGDR